MACTYQLVLCICAHLCLVWIAEAAVRSEETLGEKWEEYRGVKEDWLKFEDEVSPLSPLYGCQHHAAPIDTPCTDCQYTLTLCCAA